MIGFWSFGCMEDIQYPLSAAKDIRQAFGGMAMNDEETVALIAGGHTFGKAHGAHKPEECVGQDPVAAGLEAQGLGWSNKCGKGKAGDTVTSGLEGAWSINPIVWTTQYLDNLFAFDWVQTKSPAGAIQWVPKDGQAANLVPDAHDKSKHHAPIMFTTDLALKEDPEFRKISLRFKENPKEFELAFAVGGLRALGANTDGSNNGIFTDKPGTLSNDFFVNLLDMSTQWKKSAKTEGMYEGVDRKTGKLKWTATPVDLVFGSQAELRAIAEIYAADDAEEKFVHDFVRAWNKVMMLDRFDVK